MERLQDLKMEFWCLLAVLFALYLWWINTPRLKHPELVEEAYRAATERHRVRQRYALDPALNGYLSPTFLPFWGRYEERVEDGRTEQVIKRWAAYGSQHKNVRVDHRALLSDEAYLEAKADFEELFEELCCELEKPCFVVPRDSLTIFIDSFFHVMPKRYLVGALVALGESRVAEERLGEAFYVLRRALQLSRNLGEQGDTIERITSQGNVVRTVSAFTGLIPPSYDSVECWKELMALSLPAEDSGSVKVYFEDQLATQVNFFRDQFSIEIEGRKIRNQGTDYIFNTLWRFLGQGRREERAFCNGMVDLMRQLDLGQTPKVSMSRFLLIAPVLIPSGKDPETWLNLIADAHALHLGLGLSSALLVHRLETGSFPIDLSQLQLDLDLSAATWNEAKAELFIRRRRKREPREGHSCSNVFCEHPWLIDEDQGWRYLLGRREGSLM